MMEIKFRAWDGEEMNYQPMCELEYRQSINDFWIDNLDKIMQYTGLEDKNGVNIYFGDIIKYGDTTTVVGETANNLAALFFNLVMQREPYEVIGNKFENPELLK